MSLPFVVVAVAVLALWGGARAVARRTSRGVPTHAAVTVPFAEVVPRLLARLTRARAERRFDARLPDTVAAVARGLRSGASLRRALADAAAAAPEPVADALRGVVAAADAGTPLTTALDGWARRCPRPDVLLLVAALSLAHDTGGASAQAVDGVAATLRRRQAARAETVALATQARMSAYVLAGAPLVVCLLSLVTGGASARFLLGTPVGLGCLALGLALEGVGAWWMVRLTRWSAA
jgi:tight adherence protein B